jgi:hypothetical protein
MGSEERGALRQLFGSGVAGAEDALATTVVPRALTRDAAVAYREVAVKNLTDRVQQIRIQIIDKVLPYLPK